MKSHLKNLLRPLYSIFLYSKNWLRGVFGEYLARRFPQTSAKLEMKRQKQQNLIRPVNISEPIYFNEKMLWLKYYLYNKSQVVAQCYNKYEVREYVKSKGLGYILNDLYGVWDNVSDIQWSELPDEFVVKLSNGYYGHVFKHSDCELNIQEAKRILRDTVRRCNYAFRISGDLFVYGTKPVFICERMLHSSLGFKSPEDYKFYCFNGKPLFLNYFSNRRYVDGKMHYDEAFLDLRTFSPRTDLEVGCSDSNIEIPKNIDKMINIAKILSEDFPFVRVDLYEEFGKPIFGELTFTPFHAQTKTSLVELGELIDLSQIDKYKKLLLRKI